MLLPVNMRTAVAVAVYKSGDTAGDRLVKRISQLTAVYLGHQLLPYWSVTSLGRWSMSQQQNQQAQLVMLVKSSSSQGTY